MNLAGFEEKVEQFLTFIEVEKNLSVHTLRAYRSDLSQLIKFWKKIEKSESEITHSLKLVLDRFIRALYFKKISKTSLARKFSCLRSLAHYLKTEGINIPVKVKSPRLNRKLPAILSVDEIFQLLDGVKTSDLPTRFPWRDKSVFELLYATGVRCSELVNIRFQDIDFENRSIVILGKGKKSRIVLFGKQAKKALEKYLKEERPHMSIAGTGNFLFLNYSGGQITTRSVQRICQMFRKFLNVERQLTPHKIRHSFATHMLNQGVDLRVIQELLGHKTLSTTQIYTHVSSAELAKMCDEKHPLNLQVELTRSVDDLLSDE